MAGKRFKLLVSGVIIIVAIGWITVWLGQPEPVAVIVKAADRGPVQNTIANTRAGTIKACSRAGLSPATGGQIALLPVAVGDRVERGQLLLELWNDDLRAQVSLAASETKAAAALARQACVLADVAARDATRLRKLRLKGLTTEEAADKADGDAQAQSAACEAARARVSVSQSQLDVARATLERTRLSAPFSGTVAEINGEIGEFVTPSPVGIPTPPAVDLVDISCLYASAPIDEVDAPGIRVGMPALISLDAFPRKRFAGEVRRVAPYVLDREKQARTVDVEVDFAEPKDSDGMLPGYSADIEVILAEHRDVVRVPTEAVLEGDKLLVMQADGILRQRNIDTGLSNWAYTEVSQGIEPGEKVVVSVDRDGVADGALAEVDAGADDDD